MTQEALYQLSLTSIPGIGNKTIKQLLSYCGSAQKIFTTPPGKLKNIHGIGDKTIELLKSSFSLQKAEAKAIELQKSNVQFTFYDNENFPSRLRHCPDSPVILFHKGKADFNEAKILAIVGTRNASEYGKSVTKQFVKELRKYNTIVVSGLAYGIDIAAHRAALEEGLVTWAVIAGGHNTIYPASHRKTYEELLIKGCGISEHLPNELPEAMNFPERNRIIAGISDGTLVIEAKDSGGALITADIANSYDREVFAVPGPISQKTSEGCHNLIKQNKAHLVTSGEDIAKLLGWDQEELLVEHSFNSHLSENELGILKLLKEKEMHIDEISWKTNLPVGPLANHLLSLEMSGLIKALPGKKFKIDFGQL